jgi:hypothetical protein
MTPQHIAELDWIRDQAEKLAARANALGELLLAYLLDMAALEARNRAASSDTPRIVEPD